MRRESVVSIFVRLSLEQGWRGEVKDRFGCTKAIGFFVNFWKITPRLRTRFPSIDSFANCVYVMLGEKRAINNWSNVKAICTLIRLCAWNFFFFFLIPGWTTSSIDRDWNWTTTRITEDLLFEKSDSRLKYIYLHILNVHLTHYSREHRFPTHPLNANIRKRAPRKRAGLLCANKK